jgi:hypothetical protein
VRRSGLVTFAIKIGSTLTGLAFVVLVTSNLPSGPGWSAFGLWQLISRVVAYVVFFAQILYFWTTRYRARGIALGKTMLVGAGIFSAILTALFVAISFGIGGTFYMPGGYSSNLFFFLLSSPQIPLYIFAGVIESILWGSYPEKASVGFGLFEIAKVAIGGLAVGVFHLSLEGAILGVMGAQIVQVAVVLFLTRKEYSDRINTSLISRMTRTGWVAILNQLQPMVVTFDFLIVALVTGSDLPIALFGAATVFAYIVSYSNWLAAGLYTGLLAGRDPSRSTNQVLELQYAFMLPMVVGAIVLAPRLLHLLNPNFVQAWPILVVLSLGLAFSALSMTFDNVITGTDTTDALNRADFALYLKSKLFLVAKINIILGVIYLAAVSILSKFIGAGSGTFFFGLSASDFLGVLWAVSQSVMWVVAVALKSPHVLAITKITVPLKTGLGFLAGSAAFAIVLYTLDKALGIHGGEVVQAVYILVIGGAALAVYAAVVLSISDDMRRLVRHVINAFV